MGYVFELLCLRSHGSHIDLTLVLTLTRDSTNGMLERSGKFLNIKLSSLRHKILKPWN